MNYKVILCNNKTELENNLNKYCNNEEWVIHSILSNVNSHNTLLFTLILFKTY